MSWPHQADKTGNAKVMASFQLCHSMARFFDEHQPGASTGRILCIMPGQVPGIGSMEGRAYDS